LDCTHHKLWFFPSCWHGRRRRLGSRELSCKAPSLGIRCMSSSYLFLACREEPGSDWEGMEGNLCLPVVSFSQLQLQQLYGHLQCCRSPVGVHPHPRVRGDCPSEYRTWNTVSPLYCSRMGWMGSAPQHVDSHVGCAALAVIRSPRAPQALRWVSQDHHPIKSRTGSSMIWATATAVQPATCQQRAD